MSPARSWVPDPIEVAAGLAFSAMASGFWCGRCLAALAAWGAMVARSRLTLIRIDLLRALGRDEAARAACRRAMGRIEQRRRALAGRHRPGA